jgi:dTDP-4-dehydrorhamnose reductase
MDLCNLSSIRSCVARLKPSAVINAAAYTAVDRAEAEPARCFQVNAHAVQALCEVCRELDCPLVQISTDYVFGGDSGIKRPRRETDCPAPVNTYGASKLEGESAAGVWHKHIIVRTCGLYSASANGPRRGRNFPDTMLTLARQRPHLRIVNDQMCTPSYVPHVTTAVIRLLQLGAFGTYHITNDGCTTWYDFANELFRQLGRQIALAPISTSEFGAAAPRPAYSVLDNSKFRRLGVSELPNWRDGLNCYLNALYGVQRSEDGSSNAWRGSVRSAA